MQWSGQRAFEAEENTTAKGLGWKGTERNVWAITEWAVAREVWSEVRKTGRYLLGFGKKSVVN